MTGLDVTRIRRDNNRDTLTLARLYEREDSDRGYLARQLVRLLEQAECVCGQISGRHCPVHQDEVSP